MLHASVLSYALVDASWAVGLVIGSLLVGRLRHLPLRVSTAYMVGAQGCLIGVFSLLHAPTLAAATLLVGGVANGTGNALKFAMMQRLIPEHVRGRVFGVLMTLLGLASPLGAHAAAVSLPILPLWWGWALGSPHQPHGGSRTESLDSAAPGRPDHPGRRARQSLAQVPGRDQPTWAREPSDAQLQSPGPQCTSSTSPAGSPAMSVGHCRGAPTCGAAAGAPCRGAFRTEFKPKR